MSNVLLERVSGFVNSAGYESGLSVKYHDWSDKDLKLQRGFICYRLSGTEDSNVLLQGIGVTIQLVKAASDVEAGHALMADILKLFRGNTKPEGVVRFDPVGGINGPMRFENSRRYWELEISCLVEDL